VRGLRYPVETVLELLSSGLTIDEILADYEDLEPRRVANWLSSSGQDAIHTLHMPNGNRTTDVQVLECAAREDLNWEYQQ